MNATIDLQSALRNHLLASPGVTFALGSHAVFDDVPRGTPFPYVFLGDVETRDWSTQRSRGAEHALGLHVWSDHKGRKEALSIIDALDKALDGAALPLVAHRLVNLRTLFWTVLQDQSRGLYHGLMRLRAVTEPL